MSEGMNCLIFCLQSYCRSFSHALNNYNLTLNALLERYILLLLQLILIIIKEGNSNK